MLSGTIPFEEKTAATLAINWSAGPNGTKSLTKEQSSIKLEPRMKQLTQVIK